MKNNTKLVIILILSLFIIPNVLAMTSEITVKGNPFHSIFVQVANPDDNTVLKKHSAPETDVTGETTFEYETYLDEISFFVVMWHPLTKEKTEKWVRRVKVEDEMFIDVSTEKLNGEEPETAEVQENEAVDIETNIDEGETGETQTEDVTEQVQETEEITERNGGITGFFISEETGKLSKRVYFVIGSVVVIFALLIFIMKARKGLTPPHLKSKLTLEQELKDAEKKLREAQDEIKDIKTRKNEITDAEEEYKRAKERLEKIKNEHAEITERMAQQTEDEKRYQDFQDTK